MKGLYLFLVLVLCYLAVSVFKDSIFLASNFAVAGLLTLFIRPNFYFSLAATLKGMSCIALLNRYPVFSEINDLTFDYISSYQIALNVCLLVFPFLPKRISNVKVELYAETKSLDVVLLVFATALSILGFYSGVSKMGASVSLPFYGSALINYSREILIPFLFLFILYLSPSLPDFKKKLFIFLLWAVLDSALAGSRGLFLTPVVLSMMVFIFRYGYVSKRILIVMGFLLFLLVGAFTVRRNGLDDLMEIFLFLSSNFGLLFGLIFERIFQDGIVYYKVLSLVGSADIVRDGVADFGSFARFHTHFIDGFPLGAGHSSGSSSSLEVFTYFGSAGLFLLNITVLFYCRFLIGRYRRFASFMVPFKIYVDFLVLSLMFGAPILTLISNYKLWISAMASLFAVYFFRLFFVRRYC